jgi:hypothetical protein
MKRGVKFLFVVLLILAPRLLVGEEKVIAVGFVGGFVRHDDPRHAEVRFASYLRQHYPGSEVAVFGNHDERHALGWVAGVFHKERGATIVIFGHSWGGTATVKLARALNARHIPVLLTIQIDSIGKPGAENRTIPANVANAMNFYQSTGLLHGQTEIVASDPGRTKILGNVEMSYRDHPIDCDEFPWYARFFTRSHIEIENDPRVWQQAAALIDQELTLLGHATRAQSLAGMRK